MRPIAGNSGSDEEELQRKRWRVEELDGQPAGGDQSNFKRGKTSTRGEDRWEDVEDDEGKPAKKKIKIAQIDDRKGRQTTFTKRKNGLIKKSRELSVLCGCDIAILMTNMQGKLLQFDTGCIDQLISRYHEKGADERYGMRAPTERSESGQSMTGLYYSSGSEVNIDSFELNSRKDECMGPSQKLPSAFHPGSGMAGQHRDEAPHPPSSSMAMSPFHSAAEFEYSSNSGGADSMAQDHDAGSAVQRQTQEMAQAAAAAATEDGNLRRHRHQTLAQALNEAHEIEWLLPAHRRVGGARAGSFSSQPPLASQQLPKTKSPGRPRSEPAPSLSLRLDARSTPEPERGCRTLSPATLLSGHPAWAKAREGGEG